MNNRVSHHCSSLNCKNSQLIGTKNKISLFRFPKNDERCNTWKTNCGNPLLKDKSPQSLYLSHRLCPDHFTMSQFMNDQRNKLIWNAIPTIFPGNKLMTGATSNNEQTMNNKSSNLLVDNEESVALGAEDKIKASGTTGKLHLETNDNASSLLTNFARSVPECLLITENEQAAMKNLIHEYYGFVNIISTKAPMPNNKKTTPSLIEMYRYYAAHHPESVASFLDRNEIPNGNKHSNLPVSNSEQSDLPSSVIGTSTGRRTVLPDPKLKLLRKKLRVKTSIISRYKKRVATLNRILPRSKNGKMKTILELSKEFLTEDQLQFFETQLRLSCVSAKGRRWNENDKKVALSLFYKSPSSYKLLSEIFKLPHPRTLRSWPEEKIPLDTELACTAIADLET